MDDYNNKKEIIHLYFLNVVTSWKHQSLTLKILNSLYVLIYRHICIYVYTYTYIHTDDVQVDRGKQFVGGLD